MAGLKIIESDEVNEKVEFTKDDIKMIPELPGVSLGHLVIFRDDVTKKCKFEPVPTLYKDGYVDRLFEVVIASKFMIHKEIQDLNFEAFKTKKIWLSIWHILKDEFKQDSFVINVSTGEIHSDQAT